MITALPHWCRKCGAFAGEPSLAGSVPRGAWSRKIYAALRTSIGIQPSFDSG